MRRSLKVKILCLVCAFLTACAHSDHKHTPTSELARKISAELARSGSGDSCQILECTLKRPDLKHYDCTGEYSAIGRTSAQEKFFDAVEKSHIPGARIDFTATKSDSGTDVGKTVATVLVVVLVVAIIVAAASKSSGGYYNSGPYFYTGSSYEPTSSSNRSDTIYFSVYDMTASLEALTTSYGGPSSRVSSGTSSRALISAEPF